MVQLKIQHWFDVYYFEVCGFVASISTKDQCEQILKRGKTKQNQYMNFFVKSKIKVLFGIFLPKRAAFSRSALVLASSSVCSGTICKLELKRISFFVRLKIKYYGKKSLKKKKIVKLKIIYNYMGADMDFQMAIILSKASLT